MNKIELIFRDAFADIILGLWPRGLIPSSALHPFPLGILISHLVVLYCS